MFLPTYVAIVYACTMYMYVLHYVFIFIYTKTYVEQGRQKWFGCSSFGWTNFSQDKNKIPFLQKASN